MVTHGSPEETSCNPMGNHISPGSMFSEEKSRDLDDLMSTVPSYMTGREKRGHENISASDRAVVAQKWVSMRGGTRDGGGERAAV